jgi:hypothetical protein
VGILVRTLRFRAVEGIRRRSQGVPAMKNRRGPWLSGLIVALLGGVWMIGQVIGGVVSMVSDVVSDAVPSVATDGAPGGAGG